MREVYLDNAATTVCYEEVVNKINNYLLKDYGNPSSAHKKGFEANKIIKEAQENILNLLNLKDKRVIFTSGASESVNLAIKGTMFKYNNKKDLNIITTQIEHPCVTNTFEFCKELNITTKYITTDKNGVINIDELLEKIDKNTKIVSIIYVNNEFGVVQDLDNIISKIKTKNEYTLVHIDATQAVGKINLDLSKADMISISAHKFHGPKGVGALVVNNNITFVPLIHGGGQQDGFRSGTINTPLIAGMSEAAKIVNENLESNITKFKELFTYLYTEINNKFDDFILITPYNKANISYHIFTVSFKGIKGEVLLHMLESENVFISVSSACSNSKKAHTNTVLGSLSYDKEVTQGAIRISFSELNTKEDIDVLIEKLQICIKRIKLIYKIK